MMKGFTGVFLVLGLILGGMALGILGSWYYLMETPLLATKEKHKVEFAALDEEGKPVLDSEWEDPVTCKKLVQLDPPIPGLTSLDLRWSLRRYRCCLFGHLRILLWRSRKPAPPQTEAPCR